MAERTLTTTQFGGGSVVGGLRLLFLGTITGLMGGMGTFLFVNVEFVPVGLGERLGLLIMGVAGVYVHVITADLRESVSVAIIALFVGIGVHVGVSVAPLWILSYHPVARDVLLPRILGGSMTGGVTGYFVTFLGSYGTVVLADGFYER